MPFCRECGKGVQEDWITCPYCSKSIGPPATNSIALKDSVVMGDVSIADASVECARCNSKGVTIKSCMVCQNPAFCSVCEDNVIKKRDTVCGEHYNDGNVDFHDGNICDDCFDSIRQKTCNGSCSHCRICIVMEYSDNGECYHCIEIKNDIERTQDVMWSFADRAERNRNEAREYDVMSAQAKKMHVRADSNQRRAEQFSKEIEKLKIKYNARKKV